MSEPTDDEYRDWKDLLASPGWARLTAYAAELSSPALFEQHVTAAIDASDPLALGKLRQIVAARREIAKVLTHPKARIDVLKRDKGEPVEHLGRRGVL